MPKFIIERDIPDAGSLGPDQLQAIAQSSCDVLRDMGPSIQWVESFVTDNRVYCIYNADNEELIREHARRGNFPANVVNVVRSRIDPTTSEMRPKAAAG